MKEYRFSLLTSVFVGLSAHMFMFTNKLPNWDDYLYLFGKGCELESGRWGLSIMSWVFPDFSMPWLWGIVSLLLVCVFTCFTIYIFQIKSPILQCLLSGLIIAVPALTATFSYMFTSSAYMLGICASVLSVYFMQKGGWKNVVIASLFLIISLSIYQAYLAITSSYLLLLLFQAQLSCTETPKETFRRGMGYLLFLAATVVLYLAITFLLLYLSKTSLNGYAVWKLTHGVGFLGRLVYIYLFFGGYILLGLYGVVPTGPSRLAHIVCALVVLWLVARSCVQKKDRGRTALLLVCLILLPMASNCIVLMGGVYATHTLMTFGFISVYVLICITAETMMVGQQLRLRDAVILCMSIMIVGNIYVANRVYLSMHMAYENNFAFYNSIATQIKMTPGFDENSKVAIIGETAENESLNPFWMKRNPLFPVPNHLVGTDPFQVNVIPKSIFFETYLDFHVTFATDDEIASLQEDTRFQEMATYPYYGSIEKIDDFIVVKLS